MSRALDPISRLARRCAYHSTSALRERLAEDTLRLAMAAAVALARTRRLRWCDVDCAATDASAWCLGEGLRRFDPSLARWSTFVSNAVRREARRIAAEEARMARLRRNLKDNKTEENDGTEEN